MNESAQNSPSEFSLQGDAAMELTRVQVSATAEDESC